MEGGDIMNLEFQPKFNSANGGLTAASGMKSSSLELKGLKQGSICFKDLLSQTKNEKNQSCVKQSVITANNPQNTLSNEKLTEVKINDNNSVPLKEVSLLELLQETDKLPDDKNSKDKVSGIMESDLMSLVQSSQNLLLTIMNDTRIGNNIISGSPDLNSKTDGISGPECLLVGVEKNLSQMNKSLTADIEGKQSFESFASTDNNDLKLMTSMKLTKPIPGEMTESLLAKVGTALKTSGAAGQLDIKDPMKSTESTEPMLGEMAVTILAKSGKESKTMGKEDENGSIQSGINEITLMNNIPIKNPNIQTIDHVELATQIEQEIVFQLDKNKPITFQMTLDPENLGEIDVKLKFDQGKLIIDIVALSKETQALLLGQIDKLIKGLALQNVQVESVQLNNQSQNSNGSDSKAFMMNMGMNFAQGHKQSLLNENLRDQHHFVKKTNPENDQDLVMGIQGNKQRLKNGDYKINVLV